MPPEQIDEERKREEYEMQLFGFHSRAVYHGFWNIITEEITVSCQKLFEALQKKCNKDSEKLSVLQVESQRLIDTYIERAKPFAGTIKAIAKKLIAIPDNVLLDGDKSQITRITPEDSERMQRNLDDLQNRAKRANLLNAALRQELEAQKRFASLKPVVNNATTAIEKNKPDLSENNDLIRLMSESEELYKQLPASVCTSKRKNLYNPPVTHLREYDAIHFEQC